MRPVRSSAPRLENLRFHLQRLGRRQPGWSIRRIDDSADSVALLGRFGAVVDGAAVPKDEITRLSADFQRLEAAGGEVREVFFERVKVI